MCSFYQDKLFVISAPSAGGKTTIVNRLVDLLKGELTRVITCTTRPKRDGEVQGVDYNFITKDEYDLYLKRGLFAENAVVYGNYYGVLKSDLEKPGIKVISLDKNGVKNFKKQGVKATYVFIIPPSLEILKERLLKRGSERPEDMEVRLYEAKKEIEATDSFDYVVINDDLDKAVTECKKIINGEM